MFLFLQFLSVMSTQSEGEYKWIGHCVDHFSKYHILFRLMQKEATEAAANLADRVFSYFGFPYILHSDRGKEFANSVVIEIVKS